jgi:hypothetical protein
MSNDEVTDGLRTALHELVDRGATQAQLTDACLLVGLQLAEDLCGGRALGARLRLWASAFEAEGRFAAGSKILT